MSRLPAPAKGLFGFASGLNIYVIGIVRPAIIVHRKMSRRGRPLRTGGPAQVGVLAPDEGAPARSTRKSGQSSQPLETRPSTRERR